MKRSKERAEEERGRKKRQIKEKAKKQLARHLGKGQEINKN